MIKLEDIRIGDEVTVVPPESRDRVIGPVEGDDKIKWVNIEGDDCLIAMKIAGCWEPTNYIVVGREAMFR